MSGPGAVRPRHSLALCVRICVGPALSPLCVRVSAHPSGARALASNPRAPWCRGPPSAPLRRAALIRVPPSLASPPTPTFALICVPPIQIHMPPIRSAGPKLRSACHPSSPARSFFPGENPKPYCLGKKSYRSALSLFFFRSAGANSVMGIKRAAPHAAAHCSIVQSNKVEYTKV